MIAAHRTITLAAALMLASANFAFATGAIAVDDTAGDKPSAAGYGIGFGDDKDSAKASAMKKCESAGNENCRIAVWFKKCGAYAASADHYGIGWGSTAEDAKSTALEKCGNDTCRVVANDCEE